MSQVKPELLDVARQRENGKEGFTPLCTATEQCAFSPLCIEQCEVCLFSTVPCEIHIHSCACVKCREDGVAG